jgi:uncharacterized membrane protein (Fun14 family)
MEDLIAPIMFMFVIGGVSGYLAGNLVKRVSGMALTIGVVAFIVIILAYTGNLDLNFDAITSNISNVLGIITPLGIVALLSSVPFVASFVAGLFVGFRRN